MKFDSKYFDSIKISSSKKKKETSSDQICQWEGCSEPGTCKAPMGRMHEGKYLFFCVEHVREYNKNFNYFSGLSQSDISRFQRESMVGCRPTWSNKERGGTAQAAKEFSRMPSGTAATQNKIRKIMGISAKVGEPVAPVRRLKPLEQKAFNVLGLTAAATAAEIKSRYKDLVKKYHPDTNSGDRATEELFAEVISAYKILQKSGFIS